MPRPPIENTFEPALFRNPDRPTRKEIETAAHFAALGLFVTVFSFTEGLLWMALVATTNVGFPMGQAVMSGLRMAEAISALRRAIEVKGIQGLEREYLHDCLRQLADINQMRNDVLHHGMFREKGKQFTVSNALKAMHLPNKLRELPISVETLHQMIMDLFAINYCLLNHLSRWIGRKKKALKWRPSPAEQRLWLYKPPQPIRQRPKRQKATPKRSSPATVNVRTH